MKNEIDSRTLLRVYEYIQQHGDLEKEGKHFAGLSAFSDPDGYTLYLQGSGVLMRYGFHNTYHLDYQSEKNKADFLQKIAAIEKLAK